MKSYILMIGWLWLHTSVSFAQDELPKPMLDKLSPAAIEAQKTISETAEWGPQNVTPQLAAVWKFLIQNAEKYRLSPDASNVQLVAERTSLRGNHHYFQQTLGGIDVDKATLVVSTNRAGQITRVYTSMIPVTADKVARAAKANIDSGKAFDVAWETLGAQGDTKTGLFSEPSAKLTYVATKSGFRLSYAVDLHVIRKLSGLEAPAANEPGLWRVMVDAITGEPIGDPIRLSSDHKGEEATYDKRAGDRGAAFELYQQSVAQKMALEAAAVPELKTVENGSALVFDPDPMTRLMNPSLNDGSPPSAFDAAYQQVVLLEITKRGGRYFLEGPWVRLDDFEGPAVAPSTTSDGNWTAKRGDVAFNDAMTYFHLDRSQRYIRSLGFTGIQAGPIRVDANGLNGGDNSHYIPSNNTLAFGHGCVDDNEDADVILHEYGHAITHSVNPQWFGGDSGAIGEGFGDYWAETSSYASPNGPTFQPFRTFDWDASSGCWPGRRLDIKPTDALYDPSRSYGAHQRIGGGVISDELWSTPLYQAHVALRQAGIPRAEIDQIVLESMFGIGSGFSMRDLADSVVDTARTLFPTGPHAAAFERQFKLLKILP